VINDGIIRVRKEIDRVRRGRLDPSARSTSISFEDDEAVFTDVSSYDDRTHTLSLSGGRSTLGEGGSNSTGSGWTSDFDLESEFERECEAPNPITSKEEHKDQLDLPFEDDFDDFILTKEV
jgi:hypothetical protein